MAYGVPIRDQRDESPALLDGVVVVVDGVNALLPCGGWLDPVAVCWPSIHSGICFRAASVMPSLKTPRSASHENWSTGTATRWPPTPRTPPAVTTSRSIFLLLGSISIVDTWPILP